jgi:hypothetical protein
MKRNQVTLAVLLAALSFFAAPSASALPESQVAAIKKTVADTPAAELAAAAADIVAHAAQIDKQEVAVTTVREIASQRAATVIASVGAIAKASHEVSVTVAAEAAKLVAERSAEIAKAAAAADPAHADQIAAAVAKVSPRSAAKVAHAVVTVVPELTPRIIDSVINTVPTARTPIQQDTTITRISDKLASQSGNNGVIFTLPGTISGQPIPDQAPTDAGTPTAGADPNRYHSP